MTGGKEVDVPSSLLGLKSVKFCKGCPEEDALENWRGDKK